MKSLQLKTLLIFLLLSLGLVFLDSQRLLEAPKSFLQIVTIPVQGGINLIKNSLGETFSFVTFWKSGEARVRNLEQRNLELVGYKAQFDLLKIENEELLKQLSDSRQKVAGKNLLPATVLGVSRYLEIAALGQEGLKEGQSVIYLSNLVGRVAKVSGRVGYVQLPTDSQSKILAKVGAVRGLVVGQFNSGVKLTQIAQNEDIGKDDLVLTSGEGGTYLPDLIIGKVAQTQDNQAGLFKEAVLTALVDYAKLTTVFVILE